MKPTIGFFGLGEMGYPVAGRLADAGFLVAVADPQCEVVERWASEFGEAGLHPADAEIVITCVSDDRALRALLLEPRQLVAQLRPGRLLIDHTTASAVTAREIASIAHANQIGFVDAPMSGGVEAAAAGTLSVMLGGAPEDAARARAVIATYASRVVHLGPPGAGQLAKLANQIAIAGTVRGLAEAAALARAAGLDVASLCDALAAGSANSAQLARTRSVFTHEGFDFAAAFGWLEKDLQLATDTASRLGLEVPLTRLVETLLERR